MSDSGARLQAIEPQRSIIVQAPAGSGKTTLLVERYLGLLAVVEAPEEILAITFTRKAAAEMRHRVLVYLDPDYHSEAEHEQGPLRKAAAVRDKVLQWRLRENPQRLLIRTIDSFNHYLARTMPVASALGPVPAPADNTKALYRQAARNVLNQVESNEPLAHDLELLLDWRDHRSQDIENLLASLLGRRDQWLRALRVSGTPQREQLERVLHSVVNAQLADAQQALTRALAAAGIADTTLTGLLQFAAANLVATNRTSTVIRFANCQRLPGADPEQLPLWTALADALLTTTAGGQFRKTVTVANGFPPGSDEKQQFLELLGTLTDSEQLRISLHRVRNLPTPNYSDQEWAVLDALVRVLNRSAAELELVFARANQTDYTGLAAAALRGLGDEDSGYTDLGLYLDRRIRHLLVDEFQDTNWGQMHLLEKLTAGWENGDGRSLFLVGDPMQSIYRFREAEVGLFIRARDQGVGPVTLESTQLTQNFRSREEIVNWVNARLGPIFPRTEDISSGAVAYAASVAGRGTGGQVDMQAYVSEAAEAAAIARLIESSLAEHADDPDYKAAIIVRARSHLRQILPALSQRQIAYRAVKLDPLTSRSVVQDLLALTRAIVLPTDISAILAILRSPMCGLTLHDLHALNGDGNALTDPQALDRLDEAARTRAEQTLGVIADAQQQWRRRGIRDLVEGAWHRLGGPACCTRPETDLRDAGVFLNTLDTAENNRLLDDWNNFEELLEGEYTEGDPPSDAVKLEILTLHGAKGLEWDLVVVPALNRRPGGRDSTLLHWLPFADEKGEEQILLAPLRAADEAENPPLVQLIANAQKARDAFENQRLLYVAATRARERLVLSACLDPAADSIKPASGSLLADLWPTTSADFLAALQSSSYDPDADPTSTATATQPDQTLRRVAAGWQPDIGHRLDYHLTLTPQESTPDIEYDWAGMQARRTGTVLHRLLERVGRVGIEDLQPQDRMRLVSRIPILLRAMGTRAEALEQAQQIIENAFSQTLDSTTGQWLLSNRHQQAACELALTGLIDGQLVNIVIDRTFVDEDGVRWIIDYKSGYHAGADLEAFFAQERERYSNQLIRYQRLFAQLEQRLIKTALYLPRHGRLEVVTTSTSEVSID